MVYNTVARNFYSTILKKSIGEKKEIKEDLVSKKFWWKIYLTDLDSWIAFYYQDGRFPGSEKLTNILQVDKPIFFKTETFFLPPVLYKKFSGTDAKVLACISCFEYLF